MTGFQTVLGDETFHQEGNRFFIGDRLVGWLATDVDGTRLFCSKRREKEHFFRKYAGWGMNADLLVHLKRLDVDAVYLIIDYGLKVLKAPLPLWFTHGAECQYRGFERQIILPEKYFIKC